VRCPVDPSGKEPLQVQPVEALLHHRFARPKCRCHRFGSDVSTGFELHDLSTHHE
jgi:hypothetical protein